MPDNLDIFGRRFNNVTGIKVTDTNDNILTYVRPQGTIEISQNGTIDVSQYANASVSVGGGINNQNKTVTPSESQQSVTADSGYTGLGTVTVEAISNTYVGTGITRRSSSDLTASGATVTVPAGYYASQGSKAVSSGSASAPSTISGTSATASTGTNTLTLTKTVSVTPTVTAGYVSSGTATNSNVSLTANVTTKGSATITPTTTDQTIASGTYLTGTQTISGDANLVAGNIKSGTTIFGVTGTYSGSGSSNNVQVAQSTTRATSSTYTNVVSLTCSKTGTYDVYWSTFRSSTSGTWGSQLYINGTAYGTAQTGSWSNHIQNIHLTSVSITANQSVAVYVRTRGSNYYGYVGTLTIIEK